MKVFPLLPDPTVFEKAKLAISAFHAPLTEKAGERAELRASLSNGFEQDRAAALELWIDKEKLFFEQYCHSRRTREASRHFHAPAKRRAAPAARGAQTSRFAIK